MDLIFIAFVLFQTYEQLVCFLSVHNDTKQGSEYDFNFNFEGFLHKIFSRGHSGILTHIFPELGHNLKIVPIFANFVNVIYYFKDKDIFWHC